MSNDWSLDIDSMHRKFKVKEWLVNATDEQKNELLKLRMRMLTEEFAETMNAYLQGDAEEMIDGLIDTCVIAIGTLNISGVNAGSAWDSVLRANTSKHIGVKPGRPNPNGLPDLIKPEGWQGPDHSRNHGELERIFNAYRND